MLNKLFCVVGAAFLAVTSGASAFAQLANPLQHYESIKASTVTDILAEVGVSSAVSQMEDGTIFILAQVGQGKVLVLGLEACGNAQGGGCKEMAMVAVDPAVGLPYPTIMENLILMNLVNKDFDFGHYFFDHDDNIPMAARFEVFEYGVSKGNLFWNIASMVNFSDSFFKLLAKIKMEVDSGPTTGFTAPPASSAAKIGDLYSSIKSSPANEFELPGVFKSQSFRTLLKSKNFAEDVSWTISPDDQSATVFQQFLKEHRQGN